MDVGLLDQDALSYPKNFFPNLEIMKLSTYYKKSKNFVSLVLNPEKIERYNKIILRKNLNDGDYLSSLLLNQKCEYGGLAFSNGIYVSLPEQVENLVPDLSIYNIYFKKILQGKTNEVLQRRLLDSSFIRLSSDNKTCNLDYLKGLIGHGTKSENVVYIYDLNLLNIQKSQEIIDNLPLGRVQKVRFVYPQYSEDFPVVESWSKKRWNHTKNRIIYNKPFMTKEFKEICCKSKEFFNKPILLICNDKNETYTEIFLKTDFRNSLNKAIYVMTTKSKIRFEYKKEPENNNFKMLYKNLIYWMDKGFGSLSFKNYLYSKKQKKLSLFLENLAKEDLFLRELINIAPKKILDKGGKWLL